VTAYYNENDPFAASWLRELIKANLTAPGEVDERSIEDVFPNDLKGFTQCHFFAGIGVWSYALRQAGWPDDREVWTGSCPCQPFSAAGKRGGTSDERHLWPSFFALIRECSPRTVFGEQVASKDGLAWLSTVQSDMEGEGFRIGTVDLCAAGFGAPHIRQRLYFVAESAQEFNDGRRGAREHGRSESSDRSSTSGLVHAQSEQVGISGCTRESRRPDEIQRLANSAGNRWRKERKDFRRQSQGDQTQGVSAGLESGGMPSATSPVAGFWEGADWIGCQDSKFRPVEPGTFPLVTGATNRVGRLRGYGNALNAEVAKGFIEAYMETSG